MNPVLIVAIVIMWMTLTLFATVAAVRATVYYGTPQGDRANRDMLVSLMVASVFIALGLRFS